MNLMEAMKKRYSVRKYSENKLSQDTLNEVRDLTKKAPRLYDNIDMNTYVVEEGEKIQKISKGFIGSYGKIEAPHYLVITSENKEGYLENVGFTLEQVVLQLTTMGIGTCWIGGFIKKELLKGIIEIPQNHIPVIVISFGYPKDEGDIMMKVVKGHKRKEVKEFMNEDVDNTWKDIMEAVRIAPSAMNSQPWKFYKNNNDIDLYIPKRNIITRHLEEMNKIDAGICLNHLYIGAKNFNKDIEINKLDNKERKGLNYITTIKEL